MCTYCGADCQKCPWVQNCKGCEATGGHPFGGDCLAAEYIKVGGKEKYAEFKESLRGEINALLRENGYPETDALYELLGSYVNLEYPLPSGGVAKFLKDGNVYLGAQIEFADAGVCYGVVANTEFILVCQYGRDGANPELLLYKKR